MAETKAKRKRGNLISAIEASLTVSVLFILVINYYALFFALPLMGIWFYLMKKEAQPKPIIVKRWNKQAGKYIEYEIDEKTGEYLRKVEK